MKHLNTKTQFGFSILPFALCLFLILFSACDNGSGSGTSDEADEASYGTGSIIFSLQWEGYSPASAIHAALAPSGDVCVDYEIDTISVKIYNSSDTEVESKSWPCSDHQGTISGVPTGSGMRVKVQGSVPDKGVVWEGETEKNITVTAGQITNSGIVTMNYIGDDRTPPTAGSPSPPEDATDVAINSVVTATFSEAVVPASVVNSSTFTLKTEATTVNGSVTYDSSSLTTFTPESDLAYSTTYTVTITTEVQDLAGNQMEQDYTWSFTTAPEPDITPPTAGSPTPQDGATNVAINSVVTATFSEDMDPASVNASSFTVMANTTAVSGSVTYDSSTLIATFTPAEDSKLSYFATYTVTITTDVEDLAGNQMTDNYTWSFTTEPKPDITPPTAGSPTPQDGATDVAINSVVTATFSEAVVPASVNASSFTLMAETTTVSGSVTYDSSSLTATFTPPEDSKLSYSTTYTVTITTDVEDLAGNQMTDNYTWSFTTEPKPDITPPTAGSPSPQENATDVAINSVITATFSEAVVQASVNASSFTLMADTTTVSGSVTYNPSTLTATFTPDSDSELSSSTKYTVTITTDVQDLAGNRMEQDYTWSFTTADIIPPTASFPSPKDGATGVALNSVVTATFSEAVVPASVNTSSFILMADTTTVSGSVTYDSSSLTATFTPEFILIHNVYHHYNHGRRGFGW